MSITSIDARQRLIRRRLLRWYDRDKRDLPWRQLRVNPYRTWISEIMLQQTRVAVVIPYFARFIARFPSVHALAAAREADVLASWSGLGYYRRARMLQAAAREIVRSHGGILPRDAAGLQALPGIGRYTAAAIASICYNQRCAVVDGNVERVLQRLEGSKLDRARQWALASELISPTRPGDFNQAMMELGATICAPSSPSCAHCPLKQICRTRGALQVKSKVTRKRRNTACLLDITGDSVRLMRRKTTEALMPSMWELPPCPPRSLREAFRLKHSITNTEFTISVYFGCARRGKYLRIDRLPDLPLTGLARKILRRAGLMT